MHDITSEALAAMADNLKGKRIDVEEMGLHQGLITEVEVDEKSFRFIYVSGESLDQHPIGGAWGWGSVFRVDTDTLKITVPMVGSATVYL